MLILFGVITIAIDYTIRNGVIIGLSFIAVTHCAGRLYGSESAKSEEQTFRYLPVSKQRPYRTV
ncbi:hypothetical protein GCM10009413_29890 [Tatumella punctata]